MPKILITDLDGTVRKTKSGEVTPTSPADQLVIEPVVQKIVGLLKNNVFSAWYGASNQAGCTTYNQQATAMLKRYDDCVAEMQYLLKVNNPYLTGITFSPSKAGTTATYVKSPWFLQAYQATEVFHAEPGAPLFHKPDYGQLLLIARLANVEASDCVFVGDLATDREAAERFGCKFYHVMEFLFANEY